MNDYFKFKQFTIWQEKCAMKVCTDACLFGAWAAKINKQLFAQHILDIGTGTGLLTLMLAQQHKANYHAIEINEAAFEQAKQNFIGANFDSVIDLSLGDVTAFTSNKKFDFIISNPPFYENQLKAPAENKNVAMHDAGITLVQLLQSIQEHLKPAGLATLLLPYSRLAELKYYGPEYGLHLNEIVTVKHNTQKPAFRIMVLLSQVKKPCKELTIEIKAENGNYTREFTELLKDYYLYL
jgi:tRNA1Val (adenine37-N6)-methyltransferase